MTDDPCLPDESNVSERVGLSKILSSRDLMMQFESLGGSGHGSEFGLVQRHFGAEPSDLLRWADLSLDLLIKALDSRFDGVGLAENTIVFSPERSDEWWTKDKHFWMAMRSFVKTADVDLDRMTLQVCHRLQALRQQLISDLEAGRKIFVYRNVFRDLTDAEVGGLHAAVRSYGDGTLFYVRHSDAEHPAGTVEAKGPGLLIGYIEHFGYSPEDMPQKPADVGWLALCERAYRVHNHLPIETEPAGAAAVVRMRNEPSGARRIVLIGNCQMQAMANLYRRFVAGRAGDTLQHVATYQDLTSADQAVIEQADIVVEQIFDLKQQADTTGLRSSTERLYIPMVTGAFLWPFAGQPHPRNGEYPFLKGGPYGGEAADSYLNRLILAGADPEEAVETYASLDVNSRVKLDRLYELVIDRQRARDAAAGYQIADIIEANFRTEQIFLSPYHPNVRVAVALASQFFVRLGAERADIERMEHCTRITPFPKGELPLHPSVCRHFGLEFASPERRYRFLNEGFFTFREYALRYMRYEWNDLLEQGMSLEHAGDHAGAHRPLMLGLQRSPNSAPGQNALSHVLAKTGGRDAAIEAARRAVAIEPRAGAYHANLGNLLRETGQFDQAEAEFRAAIYEDPGEPHYYVLLAHLLRGRGRTAEGADLIVQASSLDPYSVSLSLDRAEFREAHRDAVTALEARIALAPDNPDTHNRLAASLGKTGRLDQAIDAAERAVALRPEFALYRVTLSDLLLRQGRKQEALTEAYAASDAEPDSAHARCHLGSVLQANGDHAAESVLRQAAELDPRFAHARHQLSVFLNQQGRLDEGIAAAREASELEAGNPNRWVHLARFLVQRNDLSGAQAAQRRAVDLDPEAVKLRVLLSDYLARDGRVVEALAEAQIAAQQHPDSAHALGHLAHVTQLAGDFERADVLFREAIEMEPHNAHLQRQLARLESRKVEQGAFE